MAKQRMLIVIINSLGFGGLVIYLLDAFLGHICADWLLSLLGERLTSILIGYVPYVLCAILGGNVGYFLRTWLGKRDVEHPADDLPSEIDHLREEQATVRADLAAASSERDTLWGKVEELTSRPKLVEQITHPSVI